MALKRQAVDRTPLWLMRQAGRYLPEYRALRTRAKSFLEFCYTPELAIEATLQPIRRFDLDAAIVFSDILVIPDALGQQVGFVEGEGPVLEPLKDAGDVDRLSIDGIDRHLEPVYRTLQGVKSALPKAVSLIGFAGAPFTLATYMIEGRGGSEFLNIKRWAYSRPDELQRLIDKLVDAVALHVDCQIQAGAEVVQLFDSWAGVLPEEQLQRWSVQPMAAIAARVRERHPDVPLIAFPRGVATSILKYRGCGFAALSLDTAIGAEWASQQLRPATVVQGNLDPAALLVGGDILDREASRIVRLLGGNGFVFNLGHGVLQHTPPDHVARLVDLVHRAAPDSSSRS